MKGVGGLDGDRARVVVVVVVAISTVLCPTTEFL
jgi:hypothetical protein